MSASSCDAKGIVRLLVEIRLRHHPHYSYGLYVRLPAHREPPSPTRPPPDTLDITAQPSGSLQVAFLPHYPLAARPPQTHTLHPHRVPSSHTLGPATCNPQTTPSPHPEPCCRPAHWGSWNRIQLEGTVTQNSGSRCSVSTRPWCVGCPQDLWNGTGCTT